MSEQGNELQRSFNRYLRRNQAWVFIILTGIILFVSVFVYRSFSKSTKTPLDNYKDQITQMQEQIDAQETRIQQLEEQIKQLQEKSNN
jgi:iron(III) ABC superfamily ATP binding cassette transporter, iron(III)-binding protein